MTTPVTDDVLLVTREGPVAIATLNRPHRRNALTRDLCDALQAFFEERRRDADCRVIILRGAGDHFCVGLDIVAVTQGDSMIDDLDRGDWPLTDLLRAMRACPQPIIVLANGSVAGGGLVFALTADIILANESAFFCTAFINLGLSGTELGVSWRLQRTLGLSLARELVFTAGRLDAARALAQGLVSRVIPDADLESTGLAMAQQIAGATQDALRLTKRNLDLALQSPTVETTYELEERAQMRRASTGILETALSDFAARHGKR